jgi:hypothetical protein
MATQYNSIELLNGDSFEFHSDLIYWEED